MRKILQLTAALWALGISTQALAGSEAFRVCADPANPPLSSREQAGFENKIAQLFAKELGQEVEYTWFPQRIGFVRNTLKAKNPRTGNYKCDVVMGVPAGFELALTTKPYYRSTYVLVVGKGNGFDEISTPQQIFDLPPAQKEKLKIAMFDRTPGVTWLLRHGLLKYGRTYQSMTGDPAVNTAMRLEQEFNQGNINMAVVWGPVGAYLAWKYPEQYRLLPLKSEKGIRFNYAIAMAVRRGDQTQQRVLQTLIDKKQNEIVSLLREYHVPLVDKSGNPL